MGYYKVEKLKDDLYCVDLDYSTSNGVLNFTKEITVWIDNKYDFVCAQALTPGGWFDYSKDEKDEFDNVKLNNWVDHTKQLENKVKILMDRTSVDYTKMSGEQITYQECIALLECMKQRGAFKYEIDGVKKLMNKYIFRCRLLLVDDEIPTPEEIIDGKKEAKDVSSEKM